MTTHKPVLARNKLYENRSFAANSTDLHSKDTEVKRTSLSSVLADISQFSADALNIFNPAYVEFERDMSNSLEILHEQVERLSTMKSYAIRTTKEYESRIEVIKSDFVKELDELHKWQAPIEKLEMIQERVKQLKSILSSSKEKLAAVDAELTLMEGRYQRERQQIKMTITGTQLVLGGIITLAAYYLFFC